MNQKKETSMITSSCLSFDHSFSLDEYNDLLKLLSGKPQFTQVYFKGTITIRDIESIKLLLEGLPTIDDTKIEKYIMLELDSVQKEKIRNMSFINIDTWNISYDKHGDCYMITSLPKYKYMEEWIDRALLELDESDTNIEKIYKLYNKVQNLEHSNSVKYDRLPEALSDNKVTSLGSQLIFNILLSKIGVYGQVLAINNNSYCTLANVIDELNEIDGIYAFVFYNNDTDGFAITLNELNIETGSSDLFKLLLSETEVEFYHKLGLYKDNHKTPSIFEIENNINMSIGNLYSKNTKTEDIKSLIIKQLNDKKSEKSKKYLHKTD